MVFAVLLCFALRFIFRVVVPCLLVLYSWFCIFDSFLVDRLIYLFVILFYFSFLLSGCSFVFPFALC